MQGGSDLGEVEQFARAGGRGAWGLGRVAEVPEDLAYDDGVGQLGDQAAGATAMRTGEDVEGEEDAAQELGLGRARAGGGAGVCG